MPKRLVIVESPAKARTIAGYLGRDYAVESSVGHVRDLPDRASDVPAAQRKRFGALGVDVNAGFEPYYVVDPGKKKVVTALKKLLSESDELLLATDEDREGEAIAWHLVEVLKPKVPVRRMVFHEITKDAITRALEETRSIDDRLVDAQETRRILDRLYGYEVSPVLWKKVTRGLSAGRVQSVATRLVVQRERERMAFRSAEYWDLLATFDPGAIRVPARVDRRRASGAGQGLRPDDRRAARERHRPPRRGTSPRPRHPSRRRFVRRALRRRATVPPEAGGAVPHRDLAAGGEPEASLLGADDHAGRPAPVRVRIHHLHAHGLHDALRVGGCRRTLSGRRALRRGLRPRASHGSTAAQWRTRRRRTRPSGPPATRSGRRRSCRASSDATSSLSTTSCGNEPSRRRWRTREGTPSRCGSARRARRARTPSSARPAP